ncbi:MAG: OmpR family two-component response regulator [Chthoniobacteraceae bacterium]|nr:OmpR family two-component response regulator [Chthoniobacteraceae bacterium]
MRMLVVEDDPKISSFLAKGFQECGFTVDQTVSGEDALIMATTREYDAAIVDLMLPGLDGLSLIERLRAEKISFPIIVLSAKRALDDRVLCLQRGADDYVGKPFAFSELLARTQAVLRRARGGAEPTRVEIAGMTLDRLTREVTRGGKKIELQPREFALLENLMRNAGKVLSKTFLLERLWDYSFDPQTNVVDVLVCRLRNKIDKDFSIKLIQTMRGVGYVLRQP